MDNLALLDEAIHTMRGKWNTSFEYLVYSSGKFRHTDVNGLCNYVLEPYWFCMTYHARAEELGYFRGYRWGVEYPAHGVKPDLPDDVLVEVGSETFCIGHLIAASVSAFDWRSVRSFRIVDLRHKPADISYIPLEQRPNAVGRPPLQVNLIPAVDGESPIDTANRMIHALLQRQNHIGESGEKVSTRAEIEQAAQACERAPNEFLHKAKLDSAGWYDYDKQEATKLPPVGEVCKCFDYERNELVKVKVLDAVTGSREAAVATINGDSFGWVFWGCKFRPLDWNRNLQPNPEPEPSPELSFHLSTAFNEIQASARLLPEDDARRAQLVSLAAAVNVIREVV